VQTLTGDTSALRSYAKGLSLRHGLELFGPAFSMAMRACLRRSAYRWAIVGRLSDSALLAECLRARCASASSGRSSQASICSSDISLGKLRDRGLGGMKRVDVRGEEQAEPKDVVLCEL
jgi:hypothetical protein